MLRVHMLSCLFIAALWSPAGKGLTSWLSVCGVLLCFCHFPVWCTGSGVVLDCYVSFSDLCLLTYIISAQFVELPGGAFLQKMKL